MPHDRVIPVVDEGLGNSAYLVDLGEGRALAIDPSRDLRLLDRAAARRGPVGGGGRGDAPARRLRVRLDATRRPRRCAACSARPPATGSSRTRALARRRRGGPRRADVAGVDHAWAYRRAPRLPAGRWRPGARRVHRRLADRRCGRADRSGRCGADRAARPGPVPLAAASDRSFPTTRRSIPPTAPARSVRRHPAPTGSPPSAGKRPPTRCCASTTKTPSSTRCSPASARSRRTSCAWAS